MVGLLDPLKYGEYFYELYTSNTKRKLQNDRKTWAKRKNKEKKAGLAAAAAVVLDGNGGAIVNPMDPPIVKDQNLLFPAFPMAHIELEANASKFAVFSIIRSTVLEAETRYALFQDNDPTKKLQELTTSCCLICAGMCLGSNLVDCSCHTMLSAGGLDKRSHQDSVNSDIDSETEGISEKDTIVAKVPLIVGAGLRSLFELIADARHMQPTLCTKALKALLDVIQGQQPESFKQEPDDLINPLYDLLLDLATIPSTTISQVGSKDANWSAIACSALIGLCIARGDTGKTLKAIAAMLMSPKQLSTQIIQLPAVLSTLQNTVICAALHKPTRPEFHTQGVPFTSLIDEFSVKLTPSIRSSIFTQPALASDGTFIYLLLGGSLLKIGTGFSGSYKGHIYAQNDEFTKEKSGWLGFCGGQLYFRRISKRTSDHLHIINTDNLTIKSISSLNIDSVRECFNFLLFTDEDSINVICPNRDDLLVVKKVNGMNSIETPPFELPLQLARKKFRTLGYASFEEEVLNQNQIQKIQCSYNVFEPKLPCDVEIQGITCGKEFGIVRASNGKVYYYGKSSSLGLKAIGRSPTMKMTELIVSKVCNIVNVAIGHDGIHALLVNDDGTVYFAGTARRGEDGDTSKNRRQPKAVKPKKMTKIDGHVVVQAACNNGTSAFVTKAGKLIMYGKDTTHCDSTGFVNYFMDQYITKVALGKAHCVALNSKGQVFTFGLNNKGQCGRVFEKSKDTSACIARAGSTSSDELKDTQLDKKSKFDISHLCDYDDHNIVHGQCRVCVVCHECTGYNVSCVVPVEERLAGAICPCGQGDAGCSKCGLCSTCISLQETENDIKDYKLLQSELNRQRTKSLIMRRKDKKLNEDANPPSEVDKDPPRVAPLSPQLLNLPTSSPVVQVSCGLHHTVILTLAGEVYTFGSNQYGQLGTGDLQAVNGPVRVNVQGAISQVTAGSNHTVLMTCKGVVYTFGNYQKGQLGRLPNDFQHRTDMGEGCGLKIFDQNGSNFYMQKDTFSNGTNYMQQRQKHLWNCSPGAVFGLGPNHGRKATWIGASGDQTFIKIDESLITAQMLSKINVVANKKTILLIPMTPLTFHTLTINRRDGSCTAHYRNQVNFVQITQSNTGNAGPEINQNIASNTSPTCNSKGMPSAGPINDQMSRSMHEARNQIFDLHDNLLHGEREQQRRRACKQEQLKSPVVNAFSTCSDKQPQIAFALDPHYNVLWVYDGAVKKIQCYNALASEIPKTGPNASNYRAILSPELSLPNKLDLRISRSQASLNLLACLDILTSAQDSIPSCFEEVVPKQQNQIKETESSEYQTVNRFDNFGGGWGYSGHSVEAIRFSADTDVMICGFGMFGGRGEYTCKVKLYDLGTDNSGGCEKEGVLISETKEVPFECAARSKYDILLPKPISAAAGHWYLVWARIAGPSSDCGSCGQATVTTEDQVVFTFKSSKKANNGTDVNSGQIPTILYRLITQESKQPPPSVDVDPVQKISKAFANSVSKECFESLVVLLNWSWETFKTNIREQRDKTRMLQVKQTLQYLIYVNKSCLRLLRKYTKEIYPQCGPISANNVGVSSMSTMGKFQSKLPRRIDSKDKISKIVGIPVPSVGGSTISKYSTETSAAVVTPITRKPNMENIQLAECIGNIRALLIGIFCDDIFKDISNDEGYTMMLEILDECHISFVSCFDAFYPTSSLKWNCLCDLLSQMDKDILHSGLLSAILAGLCSPSVKLRSTFSLFNSNNERQTIISPSDNSGLPMLSSTEAHQYPILVEQMIYRTQQEKSDFLSNSWTFKDVLVRLLDIIANPIRSKIENICNHTAYANYASSLGCKNINQGLIDNCCHLLARVLSEIVYQSSLGDYDRMFIPPRSLHSTGSRFARCDLSRTWNTGNFGPDAIAFSVDKPGIAIAGAMVYSGSGSYDYQLELLYDNTIDLQSQHKWETLESISGSYNQDAVQNDMTEIKFERSVHIKANARYAIRLCTQGARTCSGDAGMSSIRGPCGTTFHFYSCDLSFNGTTPQRGQIPCILYYSTPVKNESQSMPGGTGSGLLPNEVTTRDTALQIASDITKKCTELLILARNALAASISPSDNSSNHTQAIDSEHNITPIEEHIDINWANNSRTSALPVDPNISTARDITKRIESFSKGIIETLKFDKRSTNPFEMEIEIGATEIHPKDLLIEEQVGVQDLNFRNGEIAKLNGNERLEDEVAEHFHHLQKQHGALAKTDSEEAPSQLTALQILEVFNMTSSNMFHTLLPLIYAHVANLACSDPKSSVEILTLIKEILPHIAALNQLCTNKGQAEITAESAENCFRSGVAMAAGNREFNSRKKIDCDGQDGSTTDTCTTSNHYCIVESEHPYRSASVNCYRVEFPPCVQWLTIEFDTQCGTAQLEDYLLISIPMRSPVIEPCDTNEDFYDMLDNNMSSRRSGCKNANVFACCYKNSAKNANELVEKDWIVVKKFNSACNWIQNVMILPGNCVEFSLETSSLYVHDPQSNRYGFKCLVVGYDNPTCIKAKNSCLIRLEHELAYLGGMCSANLMKKDLNLPDDKELNDLTGIEETINTHSSLLSKGFALSESILTVHQALESSLPIGSQSNERQFLKDFISGAPGSSGARLAAWLQPESRLDPNKCELNTITEPLRYGWPTQITVTIRDQYGDAVLVPELKVEIKAIPTGATGNGNIKMRRTSYTDNSTMSFGGVSPPPRISYEPTIKEKMCFKAITLMKPYYNYSFEELRFSSAVQTRVTETLYAQDMEDGTFSAFWTPNSVGSYCLNVTIDGILLEEVYRVEVKEGGLPPPSSRQNMKKPQPPNKLRKFHTKNTAGLRIRSHPTLQSEQVGIVQLNGVISFIDEIDNDDGTWLRLSTESIRQHCTMGWYPTEAWCLQYNQHIDKILLHPVIETTSDNLSGVTTTNTTTTDSTTVDNKTTTSNKSKVRHKILLDNIGTVELPSSVESPSKHKSASPSKKCFDFSNARLATPKSAESQFSSTNPFLHTSSDKSDEETDASKALDIPTSLPFIDSESQRTEPQNCSAHGDTSVSMNSSRNASPSNISSAIAGVVGGSAIKLQALQKWFKGDTPDGSHPVKRSDASEITSVSVRELVRAMDGQEQRNNGNSGSAPNRILSDIKSTEAANDAAVHNTNSFDITTIRNTNFTPSQTAALLSTPKHSPRKADNKVRHVFESESKVKDLDLENLEEELSLLQITTGTNEDDILSKDNIRIEETKSDTTAISTVNSNTLVWSSVPKALDPCAKNSDNNIASSKTNTIGPIKRAMPPSLAESIRSVFAAFLWHEGIVHDAMACASFLKFHPSLPKEGATVVTRRDSSDSKLRLSREQKAQQRHSVEVANAGNYLNIRPSTLETLTKSSNSSINNRKCRKNFTTDVGGNGEKQKLHSLPEIVTVLPPALRCLVYLWEQICSNCIHIVQLNTWDRDKTKSPAQDSNFDIKEKIEVNDRDVKKTKKKKKEDGSWCEICEVFLPIPVTYHMRIVHPGCGKPAKGKGYNSVGIYCEGWAGNCGEGGKGASSWFLMCDTCREKYIGTSKNTNNINSPPNAANSAEAINSFGVRTTTLVANSEIYTTMRENANFLLELSSSATSLSNGFDNNASNNQFPASMKRSPQQMPVVIEHQHFNISDLNKPSTSRGESSRNNRIGLRTIGGRFGHSTPYRKSFSSVAAITPDYMWSAPEAFACLESLGVATHEDMPYEIFGLNATESGFDRPLSEISYESCDPNNYEFMTSSVSTQPTTGTSSKFHRSFSMGQGWAAATQQGNFNLRGLSTNVDEGQLPKVIFRRRNNSTSEGDGSLLICYPSENLRKLVPENILVTSVVQSTAKKLQPEATTFEHDDATKCEKVSNKNEEKAPNMSKMAYESLGGNYKDFEIPSNAENCSVEKDNPKTPVDMEKSVQLNVLLARPTIAFITQKHNLEKLRYVMKRSLRIATCRIYSLQALNWLIRSVTQSVCLHDLMWWFISSLNVSSVEVVDGKCEDAEPALEHPVTYTQISGRFSQIITESLHVFLQSIADLTLYLPLGSPLQRIAIQCFGIRFRQADHQFLHSSHVFGNISKILSKSDEQDDAMAISTMPATAADCMFNNDFEHNLLGAGGKIICYTDLNGMFELSVSSRQAMSESLTDNSTETFWESDEEDRNKCKIIEISMTKLTYACKMVLVHIDNSRDIQNKVHNVVFYAGQSLGDTNLIKSVDVDQKACSWISAKINDDNCTHFRLEFQGPENTLRVRQIKLLGLPSIMNNIEDHFYEQCSVSSISGHMQTLKSNLKLTNATRIQQQICEAETLRVFRLITGLVFGKLISISTADASKNNDCRNQTVLGMDSSMNSILADSLDLREHMVGILFSRSKLSHLQKQVIVHIVHAIKKEAQRAKEDWEIVNLENCFKDVQFTTTSATSVGDPKSESSSERYRAPDTYCFEMLSMVLALSGSVVGRSYLSHQHGLLNDLLSLLHTGSDRVQRQVTALLRRILPEISPECFAELLGVHKLPPSDYNIAHQNACDFDMNRLGLLDIFLAVIAKSLQLQVKVKSTCSKSNLDKTMSFVRLCNSLDLSVHLLKQNKNSSEKSDGNHNDSANFGLSEPFRFDQYNVEQAHAVEFSLGRSSLKSSKKDARKNLNQRWFLNGVISTKQAESIISLIRDLANGKLGEKWSQITKAAIAETILNLTRLDEIFRSPENCIKTATLWLALASLCVLDRDHVEKLSSGQWSTVSDTRPLCTNHDDGETAAIIQCETCGSLCGDCDRFLHLNRKTRNHKRTVCKEEEEAIRVELHESCGRTKLFWLLALADSKTLKAMVEFRDGSHTIISGPQEMVGRCRFCGVTGNTGLLEIGNVCADAQCQEYAANSCMKTKPCGHVCGGVANERKCLPCLQHVCLARENEIAEELHDPKLTQDADDMCMICFIEALSCAPSIHLDCGHVFHYHCCKAVLERRWSGPRITFGFSLCPICKADIQHMLLSSILEPINALKQDVKRKALMRLTYEGIVKDSDSKDVTNLAMDRYAYYVCFKCQKAYYGGEARCDAEIGEKFDPEELVCGGCSDVARAQMCPKHGTDFLEYKCRYCCSVAVFFCFGTTHFCDTCHDDFQRLTNIPKNKLPQCPVGPKAKPLMGDECPLHIIHPPTGEEFALGCGVCRNAQTF